ncbi:hypothetical protein J2X61_004972 [Bacillus sp. 3255]|uniref:hypothetical protein n=1 Tax=unclassified Paenibacillus TaxID=185978 RepID=UPI002379EFCD|nr:hypothetical protein [Paenibacillus sp. MAHUQ-63]MDR6883183.1 hypothetical protein [Bacillus sp. 3255]
MRSEDRKELLQLDLLESMALSQRALARIIESVTQCIETSPSLAKHVAENLSIIAKYQQVLTRKITGIQINEKSRGTPAQPWINPRARVHPKVPSSSKVR